MISAYKQPTHFIFSKRNILLIFFAVPKLNRLLVGGNFNVSQKTKNIHLVISSVIREMQDQFGEEPEVEATNELRKVGKISEKRRKNEEHQIKYEELNFTRVNTSKKFRYITCMPMLFFIFFSCKITFIFFLNQA